MSVCNLRLRYMLYSVLVSRPHKFNLQASVATRTNHSPSRTLARSHLGGIRPVAPLSLGSCYLCFNLTAKSTCPPGLPSHRLLVLWLNFACAARLLQPPLPFSTDRARSSFLHLPSRFDSGELATRLLRHFQPARPSTYITLPYLFFFFYSYLKSHALVAARIASRYLTYRRHHSVPRPPFVGPRRLISRARPAPSPLLF